MAMFGEVRPDAMGDSVDNITDSPYFLGACVVGAAEDTCVWCEIIEESESHRVLLTFLLLDEWIMGLINHFVI